MTNEGSAAAARAVGMDVSKTTPAASTTGRRGRRNYCAVYGGKLRSPWPPTLASPAREGISLALVGGVGKQRDVAGALERDREAALVTGTGSGHAARKNLAPLADKAAEARDFFVIDQMDLLDAEVADL